MQNLSLPRALFVQIRLVRRNLIIPIPNIPVWDFPFLLEIYFKSSRSLTTDFIVPFDWKCTNFVRVRICFNSSTLSEIETFPESKWPFDSEACILHMPLLLSTQFRGRHPPGMEENISIQCSHKIDKLWKYLYDRMWGLVSAKWWLNGNVYLLWNVYFHIALTSHCGY